MYCVKCGANLADAAGVCPRCQTAFDPADAQTYDRVRPLRASMVFRVLAMIALAIIVGFVINSQLLPSASGH